MTLLPYTLLLLFLLPYPARCRPSVQLFDTTNTVILGGPKHEVRAVDLFVRSGEKEERLDAFFSTVGTNYETLGKIVPISPYRACQQPLKDATLNGNIVVIFADEVQNYLAGCVALDNQARFAEKSDAIALVVGSATKMSINVPSKSSPSVIPVVMLDDAQTMRLKAAIKTANELGITPRAAIQFVGVEDGMSAGGRGGIRMQVFRPTLLNISLLCLMAFLVILISVILIIKFRWRPTAHHDIWMRAMAMAALKNMETRKFTKMRGVNKSSRFLSRPSMPAPSAPLPSSSSTRSFLPRFSSMLSVAQTTSCAQDRCSICLEDFVEGAQLRVLFCGHEFHSACVDSWLLSKRRCPLCQFDVVEKKWPDEEKGEKRREELPRSSGGEEESDQLRPLLAIPIDPVDGVPTPVHLSFILRQQPRSSRRSRSIPRRRPLRDRSALQWQVSIGPLGTVSGYSSDVSSHPDPPHIQL